MTWQSVFSASSSNPKGEALALSGDKDDRGVNPWGDPSPLWVVRTWGKAAGTLGQGSSELGSHYTMLLGLKLGLLPHVSPTAAPLPPSLAPDTRQRLTGL